jgi:RimJ/RimL family protein N-acetyltransferase
MNHIRITLKLLVGLLITIYLSACGVGKQGDSTENLTDVGRINILEGKELKEERISQEINFEQAKERYISQFGEPTIEFNRDTSGNLHVIIRTKRLTLTSANLNEASEYHEHIYSCPNVMEKFFTGQIADRSYADSRIKTWNTRLEAKNPFVGLTVRTNDADKTFLGNVVLGGSDEPNSAETAYFLREDKWKQKFGTEMVGAIILFYGPELVRNNYKLPNGQEFKRIVATCRSDNPASLKILDNMGMRIYKGNEKFGHFRHLYEIIMPGQHFNTNIEGAIDHI